MVGTRRKFAKKERDKERTVEKVGRRSRMADDRNVQLWGGGKVVLRLGKLRLVSTCGCRQRATHTRSSRRAARDKGGETGGDSRILTLKKRAGNRAEGVSRLG